jgi:chaperonin GroES
MAGILTGCRLVVCALRDSVAAKHCPWVVALEAELGAVQLRTAGSPRALVYFSQRFPDCARQRIRVPGVTFMNVRPLHDRLIVLRLEESIDRVGAIVIPDSAKEKPQQGKVLAAGLGKANKDGKRVPLDVKAGDTILFGKYSGQEIKVEGVDYLIMKEDDVLAVQERKL